MDNIFNLPVIVINLDTYRVELKVVNDNFMIKLSD